MEVSCRVFAGFRAAAAKGSFTLEALLDGCPVSGQALADPQGSMRWSDLVFLVERVAALAGPEAGLKQVGRLSIAGERLLDERGARSVRHALHVFQAELWTSFRCLRSMVWQRRDGGLELQVELGGGQRPCSLFFLLVEGAFEQACSVAVGQSVTVERTSTGDRGASWRASLGAEHEESRESVFTWSGELAHELSNPLTYVAGSAEALQRLLEHGEDAGAARELLEELVNGTRRLQEVVGRIRSLGTPRSDDLLHTPAPLVSPPTAPHRLQVVIIDDEPLVARSLARLLRAHRVETFTGGQAGLARLDSGPLPDVVLCDVMMPGLSGVDVFRHLEAARPEVCRRFVFMTGGTFTEAFERFFTERRLPVLTKPFDVAQLSDVLRVRATG